MLQPFDIRGFLEDELGYTEEGVGYKLHLKIKTVIDRFFSQSSAVTNRITDDIQRQLNSSESFLEAMGEGALKSVGGALKGVSQVSPAVIKETIFAARDLLAKVTGVVIKFKPWEASKLAGAISKWAGPAGGVFSLGADVYKAYKTRELEQELKEVKYAIAEEIKRAFKDIYDILADDERMFEFFAPQLREFEQIVRKVANDAEKVHTSREQIKSIQGRLQALLPCAAGT